VDLNRYADQLTQLHSDSGKEYQPLVKRLGVTIFFALNSAHQDHPLKPMPPTDLSDHLAKRQASQMSDLPAQSNNSYNNRRQPALQRQDGLVLNFKYILEWGSKRSGCAMDQIQIV